MRILRMGVMFVRIDECLYRLRNVLSHIPRYDRIAQAPNVA